MPPQKKTRISKDAVIIKPQPGPQTEFLSSSADIVFYGGSAGGGKSWAAIVEPLRHIHNGKFNATIIRQTFKQITQPGGLLTEAQNLYPMLGAYPRNGGMDWIFPSGARVSFGYLGHEQDKFKFQGGQIPLIIYDELTHFSETSFFYLFSRNRSTSGVRPYIRATMNPDAESWVAKFIEWYIGEDGYIIPERSGVVRWFVRKSGKITWGDTREELLERYPDSLPKSFSFIRASIYDNRKLLEVNPEYLAALDGLHPVDREQLLMGNWKITWGGASKVFMREWFEVVDADFVQHLSMQHGYEEVRFWDMAATDADFAGADPSATSGTKMRMVMDGSNTVYIMDSVNRMIGPGEVNNLIKNISSQDGTLCKVRWEIEPGSASIRNTYDMIRMLIGYNALGMTPEANKVVRAKPLATAAWQGKVKLVRGSWNDRWLKSATNFPDDAKGKESKAIVGASGQKERAGNDDVDSAAGAYAALTRNTGVYKESQAGWSR